MRAHDSSCDDAEQLPTAVLKAEGGAHTACANDVLRRDRRRRSIGNRVRVGRRQQTAPSHQLVKDTIEVVVPRCTLVVCPRSSSTSGRSNGLYSLLDTYDAIGMIICDVLGLRIIPWILAKLIGKAAAKLPARTC